MRVFLIYYPTELQFNTYTIIRRLYVGFRTSSVRESQRRIKLNFLLSNIVRLRLFDSWQKKKKMRRASMET